MVFVFNDDGDSRAEYNFHLRMHTMRRVIDESTSFEASDE